MECGVKHHSLLHAALNCWEQENQKPWRIYDINLLEEQLQKKLDPSISHVNC